MSSIKELRCSDCVFFHYYHRTPTPKKNRREAMQSPIHRCDLEISEYRKERLAFGDDLIMCDNGRTDIEEKILLKGW